MHVIADNCTDRTAISAKEVGAFVHERVEPHNRGKGQAISWLLDRLDFDEYDAIVFIDADTEVDGEFFSAANRDLEQGARVIQGYDGISNPDASMLTRLMAVTNVMKNELFYGGKAALGLSPLFTGKGIVFDSKTLREIRWHAHSIAEDLEQSLEVQRRGIRIHFVADAVVRSQEASNLRQGYTQRQRWASGKRALWKQGWAAIRDGLQLRSLDLADAGTELLMPAYSKLISWTAIAGVVAILLLPVSIWPTWAVGVALMFQLADVAVAMRLMRAGPKTIGSFVFAPVFLAWKAVIDALAVTGFRASHWKRTKRGKV